jgi:hypothetical protein
MQSLNIFGTGEGIWIEIQNLEAFEIIGKIVWQEIWAQPSATVNAGLNTEHTLACARTRLPVTTVAATILPVPPDPDQPPPHVGQQPYHRAWAGRGVLLPFSFLHMHACSLLLSARPPPCSTVTGHHHIPSSSSKPGKRSAVFAWPRQAPCITLL